jgi:hypothetical protein
VGGVPSPALFLVVVAVVVGRVAVDAEVDEDVEMLSPSFVVIESARSRGDNEVEDVWCCCPSSVSASVAGTGVETERLASC